MNAFIFSFLQVFFALLFLHGFLSKLADTHRFIDIIKGYHLLPDFAVRPVAGFIISAESATLLALSTTPFITNPLTGAMMAAALVSLYTLALGINFARGHFDFDCGCHWTSARAPRPKAFWLLGRNGLLLAASFGFVALATSFTPPALPFAQFALPAMTAAFGFALYLFADEWLGLLMPAKNKGGAAHG